jgi:iron complex outermembrane receptor protein
MNIRTLAAAFASSTCIVAITTPAQAQERAFDIPAGSLRAALDAYNRQSGRPLIYRAEDVRGERSPGYRGTASPDAALDAILAGTGFSARADNSGAVAIVRAGVAQGEAGGALLAAEGEGSEEILVTGSRVRGAPVTAPVVRVGRTEIEDRGFDDLGSFARSIPQNFAGGQNPGVLNGGLANSDVTGGSTLNLRGLGADATLTLLNGHRAAYDGLAQGVDISAIPLLAVDRVEIVADGSSAIYGSDAVGGVANVILRRDFDGAEVLARFGASTEGGNAQQQYGFIGGRRWSGGGFMVAGDYSQSTRITARQRSYTSMQNDELVLFPAQKQFSAVLTGHQALGNAFEFAIDAQYSNRDGRRVNPFSNTLSPTVSGLFVNPRNTTYSVTPSLTWSLPGDWTVELSGTHGYNLADLLSRNYANSAATVINLRYENRINSAELGLEGPVFSLPGGDARLAAGGGIRSYTLDVFVQNTLPSGQEIIATDYRDSREIYYAYAEAVIPLFGASNSLPLLRRLTLTSAVRYEDYAGIDGVATPRLGLIYEPVRDLTLRASWGRSFKAPTLNQENRIPTGYLDFGSRFLNNPSGLPVLYLSGGGIPLTPERATTWTFSGELRPSFAPGLRIEASYFSVRYKDRVADPITGISSALANPAYADLITLNPTAAQVLAAIAQLPGGLTNYTGLPLDPGAVAALIDSRQRNVARQSARGVDFALSYRTNMSASQHLNLTASASYLDSDRQILASQATVDLAGTIFNPPHWRGSLGGTWERSNVSISTFANHIGRSLDNRVAPFVGIDSFTSVDASARIRTTDASGPFAGIELSLSVQNLFDNAPAYIVNTNDPTSGPYDSTNQPATGRVVSIGLRKRW